MFELALKKIYQQYSISNFVAVSIKLGLITEVCNKQLNITPHYNHDTLYIDFLTLHH